MIEKNIGNAERLLRLAFGLILGIWLFTRPGINGIEVFVGIVAVMLILNGIFSRCYLWYVLDVDTTSEKGSPAECQSI